jgi:hypothetical protein
VSNAAAWVRSVGIDLHTVQHVSYSGEPLVSLLSDSVMHDALVEHKVQSVVSTDTFNSMRPAYDHNHY